MRALCAPLVLCLGAGCALKAPPSHEATARQALPNLQVPASWSEPGNAAQIADGWLAAFHDPQLEALVRDTHKFESRYVDSLVGPWPEARAIYEERSPIHHADRLDCPVIFFQGTEDKVVPPNQAEAMVAALRAKGFPVAYLPFEGEGHGFRRAGNIRRALEAELYFYGRIFGFVPDGIAEPVKIDNLP